MIPLNSTTIRALNPSIVSLANLLVALTDLIVPLVVPLFEGQARRSRSSVL